MCIKSSFGSTKYGRKSVFMGDTNTLKGFVLIKIQDNEITTEFKLIDIIVQ